MKLRFTFILGAILLLSSCVSIPKETIVLSKTMGKDLEALHGSHRNLINLHYDRIEKDINSFVDEVYSPYVIHFVLQKELEAREKGEQSLYSSLEAAGTSGGMKTTEAAIQDMEDFLNSAYKQIEKKRKSLLEPVIAQRSEVENSVNGSYENLIYANSTVTGYLESIRKVKDAQSEALAGVGLEDATEEINLQLTRMAKLVSDAVEKGKEIDVKSDNAIEELKKITEKINNATTK